jgi:hypothetical protein
MNVGGAQPSKRSHCRYGRGSPTLAPIDEIGWDRGMFANGTKRTRLALQRISVASEPSVGPDQAVMGVWAK